MAEETIPTIERMPLPKCCAECGCDGAIVLSPGCHIGEPVNAVLTGNILTLECSVCKTVCSRLEVTCELKGI
jgi:hypothetical protein